MEFTAAHDIDKGPIIRWGANRVIAFAEFLFRIATPYATMYTVTFDENEDWLEDDD
jgi:hypothetical protein